MKKLDKKDGRSPAIETVDPRKMKFGWRDWVWAYWTLAMEKLGRSKKLAFLEPMKIFATDPKKGTIIPLRLRKGITGNRLLLLMCIKGLRPARIEEMAAFLNQRDLVPDLSWSDERRKLRLAGPSTWDASHRFLAVRDDKEKN